MHVVRRNISLRLSSNSEAKASELLDNLKEMFPWYCTTGGNYITSHIRVYKIHIQNSTNMISPFSI